MLVMREQLDNAGEEDDVVACGLMSCRPLNVYRCFYAFHIYIVEPAYLIPWKIEARKHMVGTKQPIDL